MTLIAAIRTTDGIAIAADSQETVGSHRRSVQKLTPLSNSERTLEAIIAGSGNADLIDSFIEKLSRSLRDFTITDDLNDFVDLVERELSAFYAEDVQLSTDSSREMRLFVAAAIRTGKFDVWITKNVRLVRMVPDYALVGWDETLYDVTLARLCQRPLTIQQAVLASAYAISIAEETCKEVKGPIMVAIVTRTGVHQEAPAYISTISRRLRDYERQMTDVLFSCADTSISVTALQELLQRFSNTIVAVHRSNIDELAQQLSLWADSNAPYPKLPYPASVTVSVDGQVKFEHDPLVIAETVAKMRQIFLPEPGTVMPDISIIKQHSRVAGEPPVISVEYTEDPIEYHNKQIAKSKATKEDKGTDLKSDDPIQL
jgi:ATP-dependent protease HslVU (ClpYQ) peptidase subunit